MYSIEGREVVVMWYAVDAEEELTRVEVYFAFVWVSELVVVLLLLERGPLAEMPNCVLYW